MQKKIESELTKVNQSFKKVIGTTEYLSSLIAQKQTSLLKQVQVSQE